MPDHLTSRALPTADGWLVDGFGVVHPVSASRTRIGRRPGSELVVLHASVSRDHAELARASGGWHIRDLGSRNATRLDGRRIEGRAAVGDRAMIRVGDVTLLFVGRSAAMVAGGAVEPATTRATGETTFRVVLRGPTIELCAVGSIDDDAGGALLHRAIGADVWAELSLAPLEFHLLRTLCARGLEAGPLSHRSGGAMLAKALARALPFQSRHANDENVRQVVHRLRITLAEIGATDVIETVPGRGYFVAWPMSVS